MASKYMGFCINLMGSKGAVGLIHPESHFTEARAGGLRRQTYRRLRRHWQFANMAHLFPEISHKTDFGISVYGQAREPSFLNASSLFHPSVADRSLDHDGTGPEPGIRDDEDRWDVRPHAGRIVRVDESVLANWAALIDEPGTPPAEARMLRPVNTASQEVLDKIAAAPRFGAVPFDWTAGWHETADRTAGFLVGRSAVPGSLDDVILQGPHITVSNPFARQPNANASNRQDTVAWDLESLGERQTTRTNYQRAKPMSDYLAGYPRWHDAPANQFWRLAWRRMADSSTVRTLHAAVLPPGPTHVHAMLSMAVPEALDLAVAAGVWASLPVDFFVKVSGKPDLITNVVRRLPHPRDHPLVPELILRALRLNCLTADYAPLWEELFDPAWRRDSWTREIPSPPMGEVTPQWTMTTPLRRDAERRQALVEIDALAAVMLGITAEELCAIYRTQFGVLRKYERVMQFDANGRQVPKDVLKDVERWGSRADLGRYELPFNPVDREAEMTVAHAEFTRRADARQRP